MSEEHPAEEIEKICDAIYAGRKIEAIKLYRESSGAGLKESKEFIEALEARLRKETPDKFTQPAGKSGCLIVLVLLAVGASAMLFGLVT